LKLFLISSTQTAFKQNKSLEIHQLVLYLNRKLLNLQACEKNELQNDTKDAQ
jgi:hypothetical protein